MPIDDEKPPRQQSNAPPPITPLRMGGFRPPAETPKPPIPLPYSPTPPDGFVAFSKIESRIQAECEAWGCKLDWRTFPQPAEEQLSRLIGDALAAGQFQAVVIANTNGKLYWAPAETWRISAHFKYRTVSAVFAGLMAETIMTPILGRKLECYPS